MPYTTSDINSYIAKAQRAQATRMVEIVRLERLGNDVTDKYLKCRYLSAAVRVLSKSNHGLDIDEVEKIIHCMIECGDINDFDGSPLTFPPITILASPCCPTRITDLIDGPGGSLVGQELKGLRVNSAGTAWEWYTIINTFISLKNVVFVAKDGNDSTGVVDRPDKAFLTLTAAQSAASSGYTIWVFPGTYAENTLGKSGVNWHFMDGAIVTSTVNNIFVDTGGISYSVSGNGEFNNTTASAIFFINGGTLTIQAKRMSNTTGQLIYTESTSKVYAIVEKDLVSANRCFGLGDTSLQDIVAGSITSSGYTVAYSEVAGTTLNIRAGSITGSNTSVFDLTGNANIYGNIYYTGSGSGFLATGAVACNQNFYGDIDSSTANFIIEHLSASTGTINFYGRITSTGPITIDTSLIKYNFYNEIVTNKSTSESIVMNTATVKIKSRITNLDSNAASYCITKTTGTLILEQAILVTSGATECVHSAAAQNMIVYPGTVAKVAVSANITQKVASVLIDSQVV